MQKVKLSQALIVFRKYFSMRKKMGRPRLARTAALRESFSVRLKPDEAREVRGAIRKSGMSQPDWLRSALLRTARTDGAK
jgi:hypothetical protein